MAAPSEMSPKLADFIRRLDLAVSQADTRLVCEGVKRVLVEVVGSEKELLSSFFLRPSNEKYARRLLHKDPAGRYSVVVMVWGPSQGTPLHDHAGQWCVECVYRGSIRVTSYDLDGPNSADRPLRFKQVSEIIADVSEAGALIPPFEYHRIQNADATPSVTIHVYCGEMTWYNAFVHCEDGFRRERRETYYTP